MIRTATVVWRGVGSAAHGDLSTELEASSRRRHTRSKLALRMRRGPIPKS
jgi:hypothetical protein